MFSHMHGYARTDVHVGFMLCSQPYAARPIGTGTVQLGPSAVVPGRAASGWGMGRAECGALQCRLQVKLVQSWRPGGPMGRAR